MRKFAFLMAGAAVATIAGTSAFAQSADMPKRKVVVGMKHGSAKSPEYRPLTVGAKPAPAANPGTAVGTALAAPFDAIGAAPGPIGVAGSVAGATVAGATSLAFSPLAALTTGQVGISSVGAPPLPIQARYAHTGKVTATYAQGYQQDVPVDASGPIYKIDSKATRTVTPFTLAAFPVAAAISAATAPVRTVTQ